MSAVAARLAELRRLKQRRLDNAALAMVAGDHYTRSQLMDQVREATAEQRRIAAGDGYAERAAECAGMMAGIGETSW